ncbi:DUF6941 family protein [Staphylococcus delphini]|uniref:Uncharacterized protein n=1 Tax=Staphylococcus delphini TaxID=53344 RepID=A0AAQ0M274_9STAP|nr:hypothetical protein [Staphylococcus delphini]MDE9800434.1 hypothetical protein [Staphylococcus delphini]MDE9807669.1 hypothetical protein [Staphylococcus delphini]MDE9830835.1 hypothetical protein [Staphylococcus delphini]PCF35026.1 hypothetical protein B5C00_02685 [Staphylococcus delphini]PCF37201.1 hypothetical protein B5B99_09270 [Staphylococcus delphini]
MAKIAWMIPSQGVFNNHQGGLVIEKPLSFIELEALPNNFSFNISFGIINVEETKQYDLNFQILDPEDQIIFDTHVGIDHQKLIQDNTNKQINNVFESNANFNNFKFQKEGLYTIKLSIDDSQAQSNFNVNLVS